MVLALLTLGKALSVLGVVGAKAAIVGMLNPFGLVLVAIAALAAITALVIANWDEVKLFFVSMWEIITEAFDTALAAINSVADSAVEAFMDSWSGIKLFFADLWDGIGAVFNAVVDPWVERIDDIIALVQRAKSFLGFDDEEEVGEAAARSAAGGVAGARPLLGAAGATLNSRQTNDARVKIDFANLPAGARVATDPRSTAEVDLSLGYNLAVP